jgi:hypothetical protein
MKPLLSYILLCLIHIVILPGMTGCTGGELPIPSQTFFPDFWTGETILKPTAVKEDDYFARGADISGNYIIMSASGDDDNGSGAGAAYIFHLENETWIEQQKLTPGDGEAGDLFGYPAVISGEYAAIGARGDDDKGEDAGAVYIFHNNGITWIEQQKLTPVDGEPGDGFGSCVALSGNRLIAGARGDDDSGEDAGAVYIFYREDASWSEQQKLVPENSEQDDGFGYGLGISDGYVFVGAPYDDEKGSDSGAVYVYGWTGTTWIRWQKLLPPGGQAQTHFGYQLALDGRSAIISSTFNNNGNTSGLAYIYNRGDVIWTLQQELLLSGSIPLHSVIPVAVFNDYVLIGNPHDNSTGNCTGSVTCYQSHENMWTVLPQLIPSDCASYNGFGYSVSLSAEYIVIGAFSESVNENHSGAVYTYNK